MKRAVWLGSNKIAKTKGELINDIRSRLLPEHAGFDMLLVGQNQMMADEHLLNAKKWMLSSPKLNPFLAHLRLRCLVHLMKALKFYLLVAVNLLIGGGIGKAYAQYPYETAKLNGVDPQA